MTARGQRLSPASYRTTTVLAVVSLIVFFLAMHANDRRENVLLQNETTQAAAVASSSFSNVTSVLDTLAKTATISGASPQAFTTQAEALVHSPLSVALTKVFLDRYVVFASVGSVFHVDQVLSVAAVTATRPGGATVDTGQVVSTGDQSTATFAVGPPLVPSGNAIFLQFTVNPFTATSVAASRAFSDLQVALYGSQHPARSNLLAATSTDLSWPGPSASAPVPVGNTNWTLVASARSPLIGAFASSAPFLTLVLGLLIALFAGGFVEILIRRRKFVLPASESRSTGLVEPAPVAEVPPVEVPVESAPVAEVPVEPAPVAEVRVEPAPVAEVPPAEVPVEPAPVAEVPAEPRLPAYESDVIDQNEPATPDQTDLPSSPWSEGLDEEHHALDISPSETSVYADWRPDPFGRFEFRRFFLDSPTSLVRDRSIERYDPAGAVPGPPADLRQGEVDDQPSSMSADAEYEDSDDLEHHDHAPGETNGPDDLDVRTPDSQQPLEPATNVPGDLDMPPSDTEKALETVAERVAGAIAEELEGLRAVASALNQYLPEADASEVHRTNQRPVTPPPPTGPTPPPLPPVEAPLPPPPPTGPTPPPLSPVEAPLPPPPPTGPTPAQTTNPVRSDSISKAASNSTGPDDPGQSSGRALETASQIWKRLRKSYRR